MAAADAVAQTVLAHLPATGGYLAGYWASNGELPLHAVQAGLPAHWTWCLPRVLPERLLAFAPWRTGEPLTNNRYGIPEPAVPAAALLPPDAMHVVLVPAVGFTRDGQRLGMGGGYYDRSFAARRHQPAPPLLVGVAYAAQELDGLDTQDWDVRLDAVATETGWIDCRAPRGG